MSNEFALTVRYPEAADLVLVRAVTWRAGHRVMLTGNRTVVFR